MHFIEAFIEDLYLRCYRFSTLYLIWYFSFPTLNSFELIFFSTIVIFVWMGIDFSP